MPKKTQPASIYTAVRIPHDLREKAKAEAKRNGRALGDYIKALIQEDLIDAGLLKEDEAVYVARPRKRKK